MKMKKFILFLQIIILLCFTAAPVFSVLAKEWTKQFGTPQEEGATKVVVDGSGDIYVGGYTKGDLEGETNAGSWDGFLAKYSSSGSRYWTKLSSTTDSDRIEGVAVDGSGNVYVIGNTKGGMYGESNAGDWDVFLIKYDSSGDRKWTKLIGTVETDMAYDVAVDTTGNTYITGETEGDLGGEPHSGDRDIFLVKYSSWGTEKWTRLIGTDNDDCGYGVAMDGSGNIYITGYTEGDLDGNINSGGKDIFLVKYNASGTKQWTKQLGTIESDIGYGIETDGSGNIYITGGTVGGLDGDVWAYNWHVFLVRYDSSGNREWIKQYGTPYKGDAAREIIIDGSNNIYLAGWTRGGFDGNTNAGISGTDVFLVKCDTSGNKHWTKQLGSAFDDWCNGVAADSSGNVYITGWAGGGFEGESSQGSDDIFLVKYGTITALYLHTTDFDIGGVKRGVGKTVTFTITNYGGGTLQCDVSSNKSWLTPDTTGFTGNYAVVSVTVDTTLLPDGENTGTITVDAGSAGIFSVTITVDISGIVVKPNPFKPGSGMGHTEITFDCYSLNSNIEVYTISGRLVWEKDVTGQRLVGWDAKDSRGDNLASGVYLYKITDDTGAKRTGKIAIIR
jgi:hypothetical protein